MDALFAFSSPFEPCYKSWHSKLFYQGGISVLGVGMIRCQEHHDEVAFVRFFLGTGLFASLLPIAITRCWTRNISALGFSALCFGEFVRFLSKWGYVAFGVGSVPLCVRALAPPRKPQDCVRFVAISDTHNLHDDVLLPAGDVLIHCGDFTERGTMREVAAFDAWLGSAASHFKRRIVIAGNHDLGLDPDLDDVPWREILLPQNKATTTSDAKSSAILTRALLTNCEYLVGEEAEPEQGIRIFGAPWTPTIGISGAFHVPGAFNRNAAGRKLDFKPACAAWLGRHDPFVPRSMTDVLPSLEDCWQTVPQGIDILVTHGPPLNVGDSDLGCHYGDSLLSSAVERVRPRFHVYGHVHPGYGVLSLDGTTFINAASMNNLQRASHAPIVFDVPIERTM